MDSLEPINQAIAALQATVGVHAEQIQALRIDHDNLQLAHNQLQERHEALYEEFDALRNDYAEFKGHMDQFQRRVEAPDGAFEFGENGTKVGGFVSFNKE